MLVVVETPARPARLNHDQPGRAVPKEGEDIGNSHARREFTSLRCFVIQT